MLTKPTPHQVKTARNLAGHTQTQAAQIIHMSNYKTWQKWESGDRQMSLEAWELYLIKSFNTVDAIAAINKSVEKTLNEINLMPTL